MKAVTVDKTGLDRTQDKTQDKHFKAVTVRNCEIQRLLQFEAVTV